MPFSRLRCSTVVAVGTLAVVGLAGCGSEQQANTPSPTSSAADSTMSEGSSAVVVPGPKPRPASSVPDQPVAGRTCGTTRGPDGALQIVIVSGALKCATAEQVAEEYGPTIATGRPQTVAGFECGPSSKPGVLASCTKNEATFELAPA